MRSVLDALDEAWREMARSPRARRQLRRWGTEQLALKGFVDLHDVVAACRVGRHAGPVPPQAILSALAALAPDDDLAARTLLHALMPGLVMLAATVGSDDPQVRDELVAIAWERIRTYPTSRPGSVAANVLRDTRKRYRAHREIEAPRSATIEEDYFPAVPSAEDVAMSSLVLHELAAAPCRGNVPRRGLALVLRTRVADTPITEIAQAEGIDVYALRKRRRRAERRLRRLHLAG